MAEVSVPLHRLAHARTGDKGNRANIALVCRHAAAFELLSEAVTAEFVASVFASRQPSKVVRFDLPKIAAFNFVLDDVLEGGVNTSLGLDGHGKGLSFLLLSSKIAVEPERLSALGLPIESEIISERGPTGSH